MIHKTNEWIRAKMRDWLVGDLVGNLVRLESEIRDIMIKREGCLIDAVAKLSALYAKTTKKINTQTLGKLDSQVHASAKGATLSNCKNIQIELSHLRRYAGVAGHLAVGRRATPAPAAASVEEPAPHSNTSPPRAAAARTPG
jgi:hypothetical protein